MLECPQGRAAEGRLLDRDGREGAGLCFAPQGNLVAGDVMLAQKVALETDELRVFGVANPFHTPDTICYGGGRQGGYRWTGGWLRVWDRGAAPQDERPPAPVDETPVVVDSRAWTGLG